jgi:hypothetical protein
VWNLFYLLLYMCRFVMHVFLLFFQLFTCIGLFVGGIVGMNLVDLLDLEYWIPILKWWKCYLHVFSINCQHLKLFLSWTGDKISIFSHQFLFQLDSWYYNIRKIGFWFCLTNIFLFCNTVKLIDRNLLKLYSLFVVIFKLILNYLKWW